MNNHIEKLLIGSICLFAGVFFALSFQAPATAVTQAPASIELGAGNIGTLDAWKVEDGYVTPRNAANGVKVPQLANSSCIGTDADGIFDAGTCTGGSGGSNMYFDQSPTSSAYGDITGAINGVNTTFTVSQGEYQTGKLAVYLNGMVQYLSDDWNQLDPASGTFEMTSAPDTGDRLFVQYAIASDAPPPDGTDITTEDGETIMTEDGEEILEE